MAICRKNEALLFGSSKNARPIIVKLIGQDPRTRFSVARRLQFARASCPDVKRRPLSDPKLNRRRVTLYPTILSAPFKTRAKTPRS